LLQNTILGIDMRNFMMELRHEYENNKEFRVVLAIAGICAILYTGWILIMG